MKTHFYPIILLLFIAGLCNAQMREVEFSGAIGAKDWTKGWTNFRPVDTDYPASNAILTGIISTNTILTKKNTYLLKGFVYVTNNSTLYIEPGTVIKGDKDSRAVLVITKGSKIRAIGTETEPIVFTSNQPKGDRHPGDWGGIILLGNSGINQQNGTSTGEGIPNPELGAFGGSDPEDDSGIMRYVRIEFPGYKIINNEKEHNGLTMCAVGRKTKIDYIQVSFSKDDSFEWFGGTVNCSNIVSFKATDDDFDVTYGYSGVLQFGIALRNPAIKDVSGSSGIEADTYGKADEFNYNKQLLTRCVFSNFTLISPEPTQEQTMSNIVQNKYAISIKNNAQISVYNTLIMGFFHGFYIGGDESERSMENNSIKLKNNFVIGAKAPITADVKSDIDLNTWFVKPEFTNTYLKVYDKAVVSDPFNQINPNFAPVAGSLVLKSYSFIDLKRYLDATTFYDKVDFVGAFGAVDWTKNWTKFNPQAEPYIDKNIVTVTGKISVDSKWTSNNTYVLKGLVTVDNMATLTVEPGTIIKGDAETKGTLVISLKSKIIAEGTEMKPIVFTSSQKAGMRKPGDWGGVVILGNGKTNNKDFTTNFRLLGSEAPYVTFGGNRFWEDSGVLKYVRIEYAGAQLSGAYHKMNALSMCAVNKILMDYVQISYANCNGIEYIGGNSNAKHVISYGVVDDDFEVEDGYSGIIQYGVVLRDPLTADIQKSNTLESTGGENENLNIMYTNAVFTNMSFIGPIKTRTTQYNLNLNAAVHLSKNSSLSIINSVIMGYPNGIVLDGDKVDFNAWSQQINLKNNIIAGCFNPIAKFSSSLWDMNTWFTAPGAKNRILTECTEVKLKDAFNLLAPNFLPEPGSPCLGSGFLF